MEGIWQWLNGLFPLIEQGGWVMWPIVALSVLEVAIILERAWTLLVRAERIVPKGLVPEVEARLDEGQIEEAVVVCRKSDSMMARVLLAGLRLQGKPRAMIREALEDAGRRESRELDRFLGTLAAIAGVAPLMGLLGTVLGMIQIFQEIESKHIGQYESLAGGIYVALITTAAGLIVAIPAYLAYRGFGGIADMKSHEMENVSVEVLNHLDKPAESGPEGPSEEKDEVQRTGT